MGIPLAGRCRFTTSASASHPFTFHTRRQPVSNPETEWIWFNGRMVPWESATVHVMTYALHMGAAVFEGIRCYDTPRGPAIFRLDAHLRRLADSARMYRMPMP